MSKKIDELKMELRQAYIEELSPDTVKVTLTLTAYGFITETEERSAEGLKDGCISMRNIEGKWIQ